MFGLGRDVRAMEAAWTSFSADVARGLVVAKKAPFASLGTGVAASVASVEDAVRAGTSFDGVLWRVDRPLVEGAALLRSALAPGAKLFFVVELVPSAWGVLTELLGKPKRLRFTRDSVCEAAVVAGLVAPRVWVDTPKLIGLSAQLPVNLEPLDQVFSQLASV